MIYQRSSLFIQNASLNHLPLASFYLWSCPSCWAEITYSFRRVRPSPTDSKSPLSVMPISPFSLITLSQPSKHRYHTLVSFEILFPFPKSLYATYKNQPRKVVYPLENLHWTPNPEKWIGDLCGRLWWRAGDLVWWGRGGEAAISNTALYEITNAFSEWLRGRECKTETAALHNRWQGRSNPSKISSASNWKPQWEKWIWKWVASQWLLYWRISPSHSTSKQTQISLPV